MEASKLALIDKAIEGLLMNAQGEITLVGAQSGPRLHQLLDRVALD